MPPISVVFIERTIVVAAVCSGVRHPQETRRRGTRIRCDLTVCESAGLRWRNSPRQTSEGLSTPADPSDAVFPTSAHDVEAVAVRLDFVGAEPCLERWPERLRLRIRPIQCDTGGKAECQAEKIDVLCGFVKSSERHGFALAWRHHHSGERDINPEIV